MCQNPASTTSPPTYQQAERYANAQTGNAAFLADFAPAFEKLVAVGYGLAGGSSGNSSGKLGTLLFLNLDRCGGEPTPGNISSAAAFTLFDNLSTGAVVGLAAGGVAVFVGAALLVFKCTRKDKFKSVKKTEADTTEEI